MVKTAPVGWILFSVLLLQNSVPLEGFETKLQINKYINICIISNTVEHKKPEKNKKLMHVCDCVCIEIFIEKT